MISTILRADVVDAAPAPSMRSAATEGAEARHRGGVLLGDKRDARVTVEAVRPSDAHAAAVHGTAMSICWSRPRPGFIAPTATLLPPGVTPDRGSPPV